MTSKKWLLARRAHDNPRGDFLRDVRMDSGFPDGARWSEIEHYLWSRGAYTETCDVARKLWWVYRNKYYDTGGIDNLYNRRD